LKETIERINWVFGAFMLLFGWNKLYDWKKKSYGIILFVKNGINTMEEKKVI
jgi:hypothetical protein